MSHISREYLDMAFRAVCHVNLQGHICNHPRFYRAAFVLFSSDINTRPVIVEYLGRALRELPNWHPDVERPMRDCYVVKQLAKFCEKDMNEERLRRMGGTNAIILEAESLDATHTAIGESRRGTELSSSVPAKISPLGGGTGDQDGGAER